MARVRSYAALLLVAVACGCLMSSALHAFVVGAPKQTLRSTAVARSAAAPSTGSDFELKFEEFAETDVEAKSRASAIFFAILGFFFIPILKGITCALLFAALGYFAANGTVTSFVGKSASAADYSDTAKTVENLAGGVGGYIVKAWNFAVSKVKASS
eukprot:TRINITY_DN124251_c0_g1_i1.p1 TRINITY_DN124251_c0_g1~~TRINITY_DN124251_c0_g1_i1.p1  ORF type:complete len:157 (+),score=44.14 TRINITY_DN124251_c0_g1_i1:84-554(+)